MTVLARFGCLHSNPSIWSSSCVVKAVSVAGSYNAAYRGAAVVVFVAQGCDSGSEEELLDKLLKLNLKSAKS